MINAILVRFSRFHVAFVIKRLLYIEFRCLERKEKENWRCKKARVGYYPFLVFCSDREFSVVTETFGFLS